MPSPAKAVELEDAPAKRRVLVVDDHPLFRKGVVQLLTDEPDLEVRAEANTSNEALGAIRRQRFDLAVVDIGLEGSANGIELTKSIKAEKPALPVLVLSMHDETIFAERALRAGARGYVMKREALDNFILAVRTVLRGEIFISQEMSKRMIFAHLHGGADAVSPVDRLTDRELEVLQLIGRGREVKDIAQELHLSAKTVEAHRAHIKEKLNLSNARAVARFAVQWVDQQR
ncbi:MAG: response regulator transcription factor [Chthoniobacterales bacterium]|jgi:DNA-binding NarL/FixJ family response regulator|nr:response regulator transcription factor [Chthoniobacterales bacterium]MBA3761914.1 response regulator transcription factor [Chthoniobacterales bacterium]